MRDGWAGLGWAGLGWVASALGHRPRARLWVGWMGSGREWSGSCACFKAVRKRFISFQPPPRNETQNTRVAEAAPAAASRTREPAPGTRRAGTPNIHFSNSNFSLGTAAMPMPIGMGQSLVTWCTTVQYFFHDVKFDPPCPPSALHCILVGGLGLFSAI